MVEKSRWDGEIEEQVRDELWLAERRTKVPPSKPGYLSLLIGTTVVASWFLLEYYSIFVFKFDPHVKSGKHWSSVSPRTPSHFVSFFADTAVRYATSALALSLMKAIVLIFLLTEMYTGVFITMHDCLHGSFFFNRTVCSIYGHLCASVFMYNDYETVKRNHLLHHRYAGILGIDPDFYIPGTGGPKYIPWFFTFMKQYLSWPMFGFIGGTYWIVVIATNGNFLAPIAFYFVPAILSSILLFTFGTYLPHQPIAVRVSPEVLAQEMPPAANPSTTKNDGSAHGSEGGGILATSILGTGGVKRHRVMRDGEVYEYISLGNKYNSRTQAHNHLMGWITCFFLGYHYEHHDQPYLPWWRLWETKHQTLFTTRPKETRRQETKAVHTEAEVGAAPCGMKPIQCTKSSMECSKMPSITSTTATAEDLTCE